jgi:hypothetical protein
VKKTQGWVTFIVLGLALVAPMAAFARSKTAQHAETPAEVQKSSKQYNKQLKKDEKRSSKLAKKQVKQNKKRQQVTHSVTG